MLHVEMWLYCINRPTRILDNFVSSSGISQCICCDCKIKHFTWGVCCWKACLSFERFCLSHTGWAPFPSSSRPGWCVFLPACRRKLREVQRQLGFYIMDSQGRKVVVCDNGTGVSSPILVDMLSIRGSLWTGPLCRTICWNRKWGCQRPS